MVKLARNKNNINKKKNKGGIKRLLSVPARYIGRKVKSIYRKLMKKEPRKTTKIENISKNELNQVKR